MQAITPVTHSDFLGKCQEPLHKVEIFYECCWVDLTDFLDENRVKDVSVNPAGVNLIPEPRAGSANLIIDNSDGIFDPENTDATPYNEYFKVGRRVKIQIGAKYGSVDYYWRRFYGFMEEPDFTIGKGGGEISINCFDNVRFLADTELKIPDNYWGSLATFSSAATENTYGAEIYDEDDAMELQPPGDDQDTVANWTPVGGTFTSNADAQGGSDFLGALIKDPPGSTATATSDPIGAVESGKTYRFQGKYCRGAVAGTLSIIIYEAGTTNMMGQLTGLEEDDWTTVNLFFKATKDCDVQIVLSAYRYMMTTNFRVDQFTLKEVTGQINEMYNLPDDCTGIYFVTLDDEIVPYGKQDEGWRYDEVAKRLYWDGNKQIEAGDNNLDVYYFVAEDLDNIVADLLFKANLYDNRAEALADMIYTPTGITIDRAWFDKGTTVLNAIKKCCERSNYRFYFNYSGRPIFQSTPASPRMLTDGDLEIWTDPNDLTHWSEGTAGGSTVNQEAVDRIKGLYSCRLDVDAGNNVCNIHADLSIIAGQRHRIVIKYKNSIAGKTADFYLRDDGINVYLKSDGTWQAGATTITLPNSTDWAELQLIFYAHADYTNYELWLSRDVAASSSIYLDDEEVWKEDFSFNAVGDIVDLKEKQNKAEIRNRIIIEGEPQDQLQEKDSAMPSELKGEKYDQASINKYGEHTHTIKNHLFQDQATINAYCVLYLAAFKDPKWYADFNVPYNPVPLELGDTVMWKKQYQASKTITDQWGIIREIGIDNNSISYTIEKV